MKHNAENYTLLTKLFFRLLPYQILLIVINAVNGIVDSLYASNAIGKTAMSAIGLFGPFNHFLYAASIMFVSGSQILYGRYLVQDRHHILGVFSVDLLISLGLSVVTSAVMALGVATGATRLLVSQEPDLHMLNQYILGQVLGIPALVLGQQLFAFLSLENQTKRTMVASIACFVVHFALNHLFVVIFKMGTFGLGLSASLATWVFLAIQAVYYLQGKSEWKFSMGACHWKDGLQIVRLGYPGALTRFFEMLRCLFVNYLILKFVGSVGLSSFAASNALMALFWPIPYGMMAVSRMLFSISIGEEDRASMVNVMHIAMTKCMLLICAVAALIILAAEPLTQLYYRNPADPVYQMTVMGFRILPLCMPLSLISLNFTCYAQSMEKKKLSILLAFVDGAFGVCLFSFILIPMMKMNGLYVSNVLNGLLCFLVIVVNAWIELKRFPRTLEDLMAIPPSFGATEDARIDITVKSMDDVMEVSRQIIDFCRLRGIDRRRAFFAGLCMEEMAGNVVTHGFSKDNNPHTADIRVVHNSDDIVILRIRDDCKAFNPLDRANVMELDDTGKNVGIRLSYRIARDVKYQNLLGLNVLTMKI